MASVMNHAEFDGLPTERLHWFRDGSYMRVIDTTRIEGNRIVLGRRGIEYDARGQEIGRDDEGFDTVTLYLH